LRDDCVVSKKYVGKPCAYCGEVSTSADHVIARAFFLRVDRVDLPLVPACSGCNRTKSDLEHYVTTILPFGGRHNGAHAMLVDMVSPRLGKNKRLQRELARGWGRRWTLRESRLLEPTATLPVNPERLLSLFAWIARGLVFHHWGVRITAAHNVTATAAPADDAVVDQLFRLRTPAQMLVNLGNGTFIYEGAQTVDSPEITLWRFSIFGGVRLGSPDARGELGSRIIVVTRPPSSTACVADSLLVSDSGSPHEAAVGLVADSERVQRPPKLRPHHVPSRLPSGRVAHEDGRHPARSERLRVEP
jgi:hypothetical protein